MSVILVAEQDASYAERIAETLRASGWPAQVVADEESALQVATSARPLLLVANATLVGAETLLASFSRSRGGPGSIVMVPNAMAALVSASDYQADEILAKPFSEDELRQIVGEAIEKGRPAPAPEPAGDAGRQLTSVDIFGDLLAEVEQEAQRARTGRQPTPAPSPTNTPAVPSPAPAPARAQAPVKPPPRPPTEPARQPPSPVASAPPRPTVPATASPSPPPVTTPPAPPAAPTMPIMPAAAERPAPRPRRKSNDDIDRKLEETLSGVMPDRLRRAGGGARPHAPAAATPSERPKTRSRSELPSDDEIENLLDRTLSSLELPSRPRKSRPTPESPPPAAAETAPPAGLGSPAPPIAPPTTPVEPDAGNAAQPPFESTSVSRSTGADRVLPTPGLAEDPLGEMPSVPPLTFDTPSSGPAERGTEPLEGFSIPATDSEALPPGRMSEVGAQETGQGAPEAVAPPPLLEPPPLMPSLVVPGSTPPMSFGDAASPTDFDSQPADEATAPATEIASNGSSGISDSPWPVPEARAAEPSQDSAPGWGFDTSPDLFPASFGDDPAPGSVFPSEPSEDGGGTPFSVDMATTPTGGEAGGTGADPFSAVFEAPAPTSIAPSPAPQGQEAVPSSPLAPEPLAFDTDSGGTGTGPEAASFGSADAFVPDPIPFDDSPAITPAEGEIPGPAEPADAFIPEPISVEGTPAAFSVPSTDQGTSGEEPHASSSAFADLPAPPTSFADAWATVPEPAGGSAFTPEPSTDHGAKSTLESVLELRGDDLSTRHLPAVSSGSQEDGQRFGDYSLLERVAVGGMAEVWRSRRRGVEGFQKTVAIKRILSHLTDTSDFIDMFIDEAKLAAQLSHANITQIYDLGKADGDFFIAMEYVEGKDLRTLFKNLQEAGQSLPLGLGLLIVAAVARALDYAHRKRDFDDRALGLVHRDVSPQNVLLSYEGEIKLCDFGIVKAVAKASTTQMGALKGKLQYMSPEQAWGKTVDGRSDIFSLGSVLFEVVTGEKLFTGDSEISVLDAVRECRVRNPRELVPDLPGSVERIILKSLAKTPEQRYQTAGEMEQDIQAVLRELDPAPSQKDLASFLEFLYHPSPQFHSYEPKPDGDAEAGKAGAATAKEGKGSPKGHGKLVLIATLVILALVAAALWLFFGQGGGSTPAAPPHGETSSPEITSPQGNPAATEAATGEGASPESPEAVPPEGATAATGDDASTAAEDDAPSPETANPAATPSAAGAGNVDIQALVEQELAAREEKLRSEYEAQRKAIEAAIEETQTEAETPSEEEGGGRGDRDENP